MKVLLLAAALLGACAPVPRGFGRVPGAARNLAIPVYEGRPHVIYTHVSLGRVRGTVGFAGSASEQKYRALYNLVQEAVGKGANAVIDVSGKFTDEGYTASGEAVIFDVYPPEPSPSPVTSRY